MIMVVLFFNFMFVILFDNGNKSCYLYYYGYYFVSEDLDDYMM